MTGLASANEGPAVEMAMRLAMAALANISAPTPERIRDTVREAIPMATRLLGGSSAPIDEDWLVREVESRCNVWVPTATTLEDQRGHIEWLAARRAGIEWRFWDRYRRFLEDVEQLPPESIRRLD